MAVMDQDQLRKLLEDVRGGAVAVDNALDRLRHMPFEDLGFAKVDHHRSLRHGMPEVIFGKGKTAEQIEQIAARILERCQNLLITRTTADTARLVQSRYAEAEYFPLSGAIRVWRDRTVRGNGTIAVVCAGTSDLPVAEEEET